MTFFFYLQVNDKKLPALFNGPVENPHVANYRMVLMKFPVSLHRNKWSEKDKENLRRGIEQQFQEMLFQKSVEVYSGADECSGDSNTFDNVVTSISDIEITPEKIRSFLPKVDWQRLASMYASGRSGAECETRWVNNEDPLINHNSWSNTEDKELISIVQNSGIYNWIEIATTLGTNRTPFQCLARYQRSLNCHIMKQEWTAEDDAQLCEAVEACGENDWQQVASKLERRTGVQCSNRWMKTLNPARERVGRWTVEEDRHLKVAVMLFKPKMWHKIAQFVSGRTQVQCRERWVNVLDPSLNLQEWTEEEDTKLKAAIVEHGHCWSKVAASVAPRTDNQCRRRWKILLPHEVPLLQAARRIEKSSLISNFVDREEERPGLSSSDFLPLPGIDAPEAENGTSSKEKNTKSSTTTYKAICEKSPTEAPLSKEASMMIHDDIVEPFGGDDSVSKNKKTHKLQLKRKRCSEPAHVLNQELPRSLQPSSDGTSSKKKTQPRTPGDGTKGLQDDSVLADSSRTDVLLTKRRKVPKPPSKRNKSTASAKHQEPLSPELPTISRMTALEPTINNSDRSYFTQKEEACSPRQLDDCFKFS
ncbi:hypothetical protein AQUCO_00201161v1 [Aquilegia coerulea]|uniref:Uncharacterized protein n=1 Tax=Aquilegia coerulea TaxID=218851 RepID=A0A2G5F6T9_AQUCA|nr:hypothetical protein AQUCO_00201161v1 [Aquilegia coerulea]